MSQYKQDVFWVTSYDCLSVFHCPCKGHNDTVVVYPELMTDAYFSRQITFTTSVQCLLVIVYCMPIESASTFFQSVCERPPCYVASSVYLHSIDRCHALHPRVYSLLKFLLFSYEGWIHSPIILYYFTLVFSSGN